MPDVELWRKIETVVNEKPEVGVSIDRHLSFTVGEVLPLSETDLSSGRTAKSRSVNIILDWDPEGGHYGVVLEFRVKSAFGYKNISDAYNCYYYKFSPNDPKSYEIVSRDSEDNNKSLVSSGFDPASTSELLKTGRDKLEAALKHSHQGRIWHIVSIDDYFLGKENDDRERLEDSGLPIEIVEKLLKDSKKGLSPNEGLAFILNWISLVVEGSIKLPDPFK